MYEKTYNIKPSNCNNFRNGDIININIPCMNYDLIKSNSSFHVITTNRLSSKYHFLQRVKVFIGNNLICDIDNYDIFTTILFDDSDMFLLGTILNHHGLPLYKFHSDIGIEIELKMDCPPFILNDFNFKYIISESLKVLNHIETITVITCF